MATNVFTIDGKINVDNSQAKKSIKETVAESESGASSFAKNFGSMAKTVANYGAAIVTGAVAIGTAVFNAAQKTADSFGDIDDASQRMRVSTTYFQELSYAAEQSGVSLSNLETAAKKLEGTDLNMESAMQQIMSLGTEEERTAKATELFGKSAAYKLQPILKQTGEEFGNLMERANELGLVMSEDSIQAGATFGDTLNDVKLSLTAIKDQALAAIIPLITQVMDIIVQNMPTIQQIVNEIVPLLVDLVSILMPILLELAQTILPPVFEIITALMPIITSIIENVMPTIIGILELIMPILSDLVTAVLPLLTPFLDLIGALLTPILELLQPIFDLLSPFITLINKVANVLGVVLKAAIKASITALTTFWDKIKEVFSKILNVVKTPINAIIDVINNLIKGLNKIKLPDWEILGSAAGKGINIPLIKKLRVGMEYVPYDEMPAVLHKGEQVLTAEEAREYRATKNSNNITNNNFNNVIQIEKLEVRDEQDIQRIAEELYYLQKKAEV